MDALRRFMFEHVYFRPAVRAEHEKIAGVLTRLFSHYVEHPERLPPATTCTSGGEDDLAHRVTDYLAGMTDRYCIWEAEALLIPRAHGRIEDPGLG
jgi:dGTPase